MCMRFYNTNKYRMLHSSARDIVQFTDFIIRNTCHLTTGYIKLSDGISMFIHMKKNYFMIGCSDLLFQKLYICSKALIKYQYLIKFYHPSEYFVRWLIVMYITCLLPISFLYAFPSDLEISYAQHRV